MPADRRFRIDAIFRGIDRVSRPINRMQARIGRFTRAAVRGLRNVDRVTGRIARAIGTGLRRALMAATVALVAFRAIINRTVDDLDELAKQSKRLDFPIEELQQWTFAAEQAGINSETFSKSMDKFTKTLGEAKSGYGTMSENLKKTNPELLKQLKNTENVADALDLYIGAMRDSKSAAEKAALGATAFGRSGVKLVNLANLTETELAKLKKEMLANGVATLEQAEAAEKYNDTVNSMKLALGGFMRSVLMPIIPMLTKAAEKIREWVINNRELVAGKLLEWGRKIAENWDRIAYHAEKLATAVGVFMAIAGAVKVLTGVVTALNVVLAMNPLFLVLGLLAAGVILVITYWDELKEHFTAAFAVMDEDITSFKNKFINTWKSVKNFFIDMWNGITEVFEDAVNYLIQNGPISWIVAAVAHVMENWDTTVALYQGIWDSIVGVFDSAVNYLLETGPVKKLIKAVQWIRDIWNATPGFFGEIWVGIIDNFSRGLAILKNKLAPLIGWVKAGWTAISGFFKGIWDGIVSQFTRGVALLKKTFAPLFAFFKGVKQQKDALVARQIGEVDFGRTEKEVIEGEGLFDEGKPEPQVQSFEERIARKIVENRESSKAEITIKDETGKAEVTKGSLSDDVSLEPSGAF